MWKKDDTPDQQTPPASPRSGPARSASGMATIGPSISIRGDVTGSEDLLIQGKIDGSVTLDQHSVSVGSEGRVNANITGRVITVEGRVEGDLNAKEQIVLRGSAHVHGDLKAPRLVLEDGATFRGLVDMAAAGANGRDKEPEAKKPTTSGSTATPKADKAATSPSDAKSEGKATAGAGAERTRS